MSARFGETLPTLFAAFEEAWTASPHAAGFRSAGYGLSCRADHAGYFAMAARALPPAPGPARPDLRVLVTLRRNAPLWPVLAERAFQEREMEARLRGSGYRLHYNPDHDYWQVFDRQTRRGWLLLSDEAAYPPWEAGSPLRNFVHWRCLEDSAGLVHAGTLAVGGKGILLAGAGGSGKSGTVLGGLLNGAQTVGDDYVAVACGEALEARLAFRVLKQDAAGLARAGVAIVPAFGPLNYQDKYLVPLDAVTEDLQPDRIALSAILLPRVTGTPQTSVAPATAREAFLGMVPSGVSQIPSAREEMFELCARISRRLPAFHVRLGTRPDEVAARLAALIGEIGALRPR